MSAVNTQQNAGERSTFAVRRRLALSKERPSLILQLLNSCNSCNSFFRSSTNNRQLTTPLPH
jgi:hypothetical protein